MRNIWKIKPGGKRDLKYVLRNCSKGDIVLLSPGEYHFPTGLFLRNAYKHGIEIRGIGEEAEDVVINGTIVISGSINASFSNLSINALHEKNAINISEGASIHLNRVIITGELTGNYPPIHCTKSTLMIEASEVYFSEKRIDSIYIDEQSDVQIHSSIMSSLFVAQSKVRLHNNQIKFTFMITKDANVHSTGMLDLLAPNPELYTLVVSAGARTKFDLIHVNQQDIFIKVDEAAFTLTEYKATDRAHVRVEYTTNSSVQVQDENVLLQNLDEPEMQQARAQERVSLDEEREQQTNHETIEPSQDEAVPQEVEKQQSGFDELQSLYGLHDLKKQMNEFINIVKFNQLQKEQGKQTIPVTLHSLFMGNPGTGKTTVARILGRLLYETGVIATNTFIEVTRKDLVSPYIGETAQMTQKVLDESKGGILFIDEAYALHNESATDHGKEAIDTILTFMEDHRHDTMIIFAGYTDEMNQFLKMNSGLESRIPNTFYFDDYTPEEVAEIGYTDLTQQGYIVNEEKYKNTMKWLYSYDVDQSNARWVRNMNEKLLLTHANRVVESQTEDTQTIKDDDLDALTGNEQQNKEEMIEGLMTELDNLIGLDDVKDFIRRLMQQAKVDRMLLEDGSDVSKPSYHMIFSGNPGTGKTTVAHLIAQLFYYLDLMPKPSVKVVDRSDLVGAYIGHTEKQTKEIIEKAMGGVLFIDEAYQLNGKSENDFGKQAIETLLTYLENYRDKFIVILAGYTEEMEEFLNVNPGLRSRIPHHIIFPDYSPEDVSTIVESIITKDWEVNVPLLRSVVMDLYSNIPSDEKANARWARNFSEQLIQNHKAWFEEHDLEIDDLKKINDEVILELGGQRGSYIEQ